MHYYSPVYPLESDVQAQISRSMQIIQQKRLLRKQIDYDLQIAKKLGISHHNKVFLPEQQSKLRDKLIKSSNAFPDSYENSHHIKIDFQLSSQSPMKWSEEIKDDDYSLAHFGQIQDNQNQQHNKIPWSRENQKKSNKKSIQSYQYDSIVQDDDVQMKEDKFQRSPYSNLKYDSGKRNGLNEKQNQFMIYDKETDYVNPHTQSQRFYNNRNIRTPQKSQSIQREILKNQPVLSQRRNFIGNMNKQSHHKKHSQKKTTQKSLIQGKKSLSPKERTFSPKPPPQRKQKQNSPSPSLPQRRSLSPSPSNPSFRPPQKSNKKIQRFSRSYLEFDQNQQKNKQKCVKLGENYQFMQRKQKNCGEKQRKCIQNIKFYGKNERNDIDNEKFYVKNQKNEIANMKFTEKLSPSDKKSPLKTPKSVLTKILNRIKVSINFQANCLYALDKSTSKWIQISYDLEQKMRAELKHKINSHKITVKKYGIVGK